MFYFFVIIPRGFGMQVSLVIPLIALAIKNLLEENNNADMMRLAAV